MARFAAIILSAGRGRRMGVDIPKQYIEIDGKPMIYYSIKAFEESLVDSIIMVVGESDLAYVQDDIVVKYGFNKVTSIVPGGEERYNSVYAGLSEAVKVADYVLIHDGARPYISSEVINDCMDNVVSHRACIAAVPVVDTIKVVDSGGIITATPDRSTLWAAQTPQCFEMELVYNSYKKMIEEGAECGVTDDAMVVATYGNVPSKVITSSYNNVKITHPEDLNTVKGTKRVTGMGEVTVNSNCE